MTVAVLWVAVASVLVEPVYPAPPSWSPDGAWVAYTLATRDVAEALPEGWLLDGRPGLVADLGNPGSTRRARLWTSRPATGEHVLLDESAGPFSSPCWAPDGRSLAYVRVVPVEGWPDRSVREVVIQREPGTAVALLREEIPAGAADRATLAGATLAWSPDGNLLAVPRIAPSGLDIIQVENGHRLRQIDGARAPSWSRTGGRLAYIQVDAQGAGGLVVLESNLERQRRLVEIPDGRVAATPAWSRDDRSVLVILQSREESRLPGQGQVVAGQSARLVAVPADGGEPAIVQQITLQPVAAPDELTSATFSLTPDGANLFFAANCAQQESQLSWALPDREVIQVRFNPVDPHVSLEALALEPNGRRVALRAGSAGTSGPVALCDPVTQELTPLAPDLDAKGEWLALLLNAAGKHIQALSIPAGGGKAVERSSQLPAPFELGRDAVGYTSLRRLSRLGRPLCTPEVLAAIESEPARSALAEARFALDYLRLDDDPRPYEAAARSIAELERLATTPAQRFRWMCLQAQVELGLGDYPRARQIIDYLRTTPAWTAGRFEETPAGAVVTAVDNTDLAWLDALRHAVESASIDQDGEPRATGPARGTPIFPTPSTSQAHLNAPPPLPAQDGRIDNVQIRIVP